MSMRSRWLFVLVGDNNTGKTLLQRKILLILTGVAYDRLPCNAHHPIIHPLLWRKLRDVSVGNRSIQERLDTYGSIEGYFRDHFCPADLSVISSHLSYSDAERILVEGHRRFFNVCAVFFSNSIAVSPEPNAMIASLQWDERVLAENDLVPEQARQEEQLQRIAESMVQMVAGRAAGW